MLDYLARYVFRIALSNARIVGLDDQTVTIQYKHRKTGQPRTCSLSGEEFMRRFLQHVLPRGFHKVRYFGLWHPTQRDNATRIRQMLQLQTTPKLDPVQDPIAAPPLPAGPCRNLRAKSADLETSLFQRVARHMTRQHFDIAHDLAFFIAIGGLGGEKCWAKQAGRYRARSNVRMPRMLMCLCPIGANRLSTSSG